METLWYNLIELMMAVQAWIFVYALYLLIVFKKPTKLIVLYTITLMMFIWLKFNIIHYELGWLLDKFLWGLYNILYSLSFIYIISFRRLKWFDWKDCSDCNICTNFNKKCGKH